MYGEAYLEWKESESDPAKIEVERKWKRIHAMLVHDFEKQFAGAYGHFDWKMLQDALCIDKTRGSQ